MGGFLSLSISNTVRSLNKMDACLYASVWASLRLLINGDENES